MKKPKTDPKTAADKAQASSDKNKKNAGAKGAAAAPNETVKFNSELDQEEKALFLNHHLPAVRAARASLNTANANLRNAYKKAKAEGNFTKADFDTAFAVETAESEARERGKIARQLRIAKIMGSSLGAQLDMFLEPDRTPAADIAFQEGVHDATQNKAAKPKYDPSTEQHRKYLEGYHSVSAQRVKEGIGKLDPEAAKLADHEAAAKVATDTQKAKDAQAFDGKAPASDADAEIPGGTPPTPPPQPQSGTPMTRAQFKEQQAKLAAGSGKAN